MIVSLHGSAGPRTAPAVWEPCGAGSRRGDDHGGVGHREAAPHRVDRGPDALQYRRFETHAPDDRPSA